MLESLFEHHNTLTQMIAYTSASLERNGFWNGKKRNNYLGGGESIVVIFSHCLLTGVHEPMVEASPYG